MKRKAKSTPSPRKRQRVALSLHLPLHVIGYLRFISEVSGVKLEDVVNVVLAMELVQAKQATTRGAPQP